MRLAVERITADLVLVDGNQPIVCSLPQRTVIGGDRLHVQISAASILAKVWRDRLMETLGKKYPGYGLEKHAGTPHQLTRERLSNWDHVAYIAKHSLESSYHLTDQSPCIPSLRTGFNPPLRWPLGGASSISEALSERSDSASKQLEGLPSRSRPHRRS